MDKNTAALSPPMGWNSWDCYGASVNEEQLLGNARYIAEKLLLFGWEYIVCDIQWYEPLAHSQAYNPFTPLSMDKFARLIPAPNRFPSSAKGDGFKPIADEIHSLGLKFGIHMMRGIPRQAVHAASPILGTDSTARDIAQTFSLCPWNTDMYGVNPKGEGAFAYYKSVFEQYAAWGVDFVKVDDIANTEFKPYDPYSARAEIELIRRAIDECGRPMVLSLSPGPAPVEEAAHLSANANMWRMTGDFWDNWDQVYAMFDRCHQWSGYVKPGCWPDCDMLPFGLLCVNNQLEKKGRLTNLTRDEQTTVMTLWCIFRSPLMLGAETRSLDDWTLGLLTNPEVLALLKETSGARQVVRTQDAVVWSSRDKEGYQYAALFNLSFTDITITVPLSKFGLSGKTGARDLWKRKDAGSFDQFISAKVPPHGAVLYKLKSL